MTVNEEVEAMVEAGQLDPSASIEALTYMAERWLLDQVRGRERRAARVTEAPQLRLQAAAVARQKVATLTAQIAARARHSWGDLLDSTFTLPSGERVTWRAATVSQHQQRAEMLEVMASATMETAALHRAAVSDIEAAGVATLGEL